MKRKVKLFISAGTGINVKVISLTSEEEQKILKDQDMGYEGKIFIRNAPELPISYRSGSFTLQKNCYGYLTVCSI